MSNIYIQAGKRIRELREKNHYTREEFSEISNISPKFLYEIESGQKGFSAETLYAIAKGLNVSCEYILSGKADTASEFTDLNDVSQKVILDKIIKLILELVVLLKKEKGEKEL